MNKLISEIITKASKLVVEVAQFNFEKIENKNIVQKKDGSFVTNFDTSIDQGLINILYKTFPTIGFISEESQDDTSDLPGLTWCIDPIDGTHNFMMDIPYYAVSVGLLSDGVPVAGIIYDPLLQQVLVGGKEVPLMLNNLLISPHNNSFVVTTNRSHSPHDKQRELKFIQEIYNIPQLKYRRLGSCALDIMNIILGRIGGTYIIGNSKWDWAAGYAIARYSGYEIQRKKDLIIIGSQHLQKHMLK